MVLIYALLAGDNRTVDALSKLSQSLFATIEDYMWVKLSLVSATAGAADGGRGDSLGSPSSSGAAAPGGWACWEGLVVVVTVVVVAGTDSG